MGCQYCNAPIAHTSFIIDKWGTYCNELCAAKHWESLSHLRGGDEAMQGRKQYVCDKCRGDGGKFINTMLRQEYEICGVCNGEGVVDAIEGSEGA